MGTFNRATATGTTAESFWRPIWDAYRSARRPHEDHLQRIQQEYDAWFQRELARPGANVSTTAPEVFDEATTTVRQKLAAVVRRLFDTDEPRVQAERKRRVAVALAQGEEWLAAVQDLYAFDGEYRRYADSCGTGKPRPPQWAQRLEAAIQAHAELRHLLQLPLQVPAPMYRGPEVNPLPNMGTILVTPMNSASRH